MIEHDPPATTMLEIEIPSRALSHAVGRLDLLRELFGQIIIPPAVVEELAATL